MAQKKSNMDIVQLILMIIVALILDAASIIPIVNFFAVFVAVLVFGIWFYVLGMGVINPIKLAAPFTGIVIEAIPAISAVPAITLSIIITYLLIKVEDKTGIKTSMISPGAGKVGNINNS
jgi:hypothetical protein